MIWPVTQCIPCTASHGLGDVLGPADAGRGAVRPATPVSHAPSRGAGPSIGVSVTPGATALTRMAGAHSRAATRTTMSSAALEAQ